MAMAFKPPRPLMRVTVAASSVDTQSHNMLPPAVRTSSARWPMANPAPRPMTPGSYSWKLLRWLFDSFSSVVQPCPLAGTYCRSSLQILHCAGADALSGYCVPQAVQMKDGMGLPLDDVSAHHCC